MVVLQVKFVHGGNGLRDQERSDNRETLTRLTTDYKFHYLNCASARALSSAERPQRLIIHHALQLRRMKRW